MVQKGYKILVQGLGIVSCKRGGRLVREHGAKGQAFGPDDDIGITNTTREPLASSTPRFRATEGPWPGSKRIKPAGKFDAIIALESVDPSSTTMTSNAPIPSLAEIAVRQWCRVCSPLWTGMITLASGRCSKTANLDLDAASESLSPTTSK